MEQRWSVRQNLSFGPHHRQVFRCGLNGIRLRPVACAMNTKEYYSSNFGWMRTNREEDKFLFFCIYRIATIRNGSRAMNIARSRSYIEEAKIAGLTSLFRSASAWSAQHHWNCSRTNRLLHSRLLQTRGVRNGVIVLCLGNRGYAQDMLKGKLDKFGSLPAPFLGSVSGILLSFVAPVLIAVLTPNPVYDSWRGATIVIVLAGLRFAWILASSTRRLFEMTTWLFIYLFLGTAPMVQLRLGHDPGTTPNLLHENDWTVHALVITGCLCQILGSFAGSLRSNAPIVQAQSRQLSRKRVNLLAIGTIVFGLYYVSAMGPAVLLGDRTARSLAATRIWPDSTTAVIIGATVAMGLLVSVTAQIFVFRERTRAAEKRPVIMLTVSTVLLFLCVNPVSSPRYILGTVVLGVLAAIGLYGTLTKFRFAALGALFALVFLFPLLDTFRRSLDATVAFENPLDSMVTGDFDSFGQINNTVAYVAENGIAWGAQALGVIFFWVPRSIWPSKPIDTGVLVGQSRDYGFTNLSSPLWAELYINGGWILVIIGMFAFGFALRRWDQANELRLKAGGIPTVLGCIVPFYLLIMLRGSLLQSMAYIAVILVFTSFIHTSEVRSRTQSRSPRRHPSFSRQRTPSA